MSDDDDDPALANIMARFLTLSNHMREAYRLWELWAVAARDKPLLDRLDASFATGAFLEIRNALHRSLVLALARMWDTRLDSLSIPRLIAEISSGPVKSALIARRTSDRDVTEQLRLVDPELATEALSTITEHLAYELPALTQRAESEIEALIALQT